MPGAATIAISLGSPLECLSKPCHHLLKRKLLKLEHSASPPLSWSSRSLANIDATAPVLISPWSQDPYFKWCFSLEAGGNYDSQHFFSITSLAFQLCGPQLHGFIVYYMNYSPLPNVCHGTWPTDHLPGSYPNPTLYPVLFWSTIYAYLLTLFSAATPMMDDVYKLKILPNNVQILSSTSRMLWERYSLAIIYDHHSAAWCTSSPFLLWPMTQIRWSSDLAIPKHWLCILAFFLT